jgi:hypothetical protein
MAGDLYQHAGYTGAVDIGVHVGNLAGGLSYTLYDRPRAWEPPYFTESDFRSTRRVLAKDLIDRPREVAQELVRPFMEATTAGADYDPWSSS